MEWQEWKETVSCGVKNRVSLKDTFIKKQQLGFYIRLSTKGWQRQPQNPYTFHFLNTITTPWILPYFSRLQPQISMRLTGILSDRSNLLSGWKITHGFQKYSKGGMHLYSSLSFTLMSHNKKLIAPFRAVIEEAEKGSMESGTIC